MDEDLRRAALEYHRVPAPGKLSVEPTKRMANQRDLALAYSPGVAAACDAIAANPECANDLTAKGNLVAVITNGTAVLGLGNIGPLASKPVMEGKAALFKKFAGIDVFDLEVDARDPERFIDLVSALEPTFGGINLEDIKAPECFEIEAALRRKMNIPVFHDDQHGTAIVCAAAVINGLTVQGKSLSEVRLVTSGAGAAALACVDLLVALGLRPDNVTLTDIEGVVHDGRHDMAANMARYARATDARTLPDVLGGADIFLGLSAPRVFRPEWLPLLADRPLILALANPEPEISPDIVKTARPDAIVATGRSDYPNQVNNVLCFPFIFRGALDVGASEINEPMKLAAVEALSGLARAEASEQVSRAYGGTSHRFGPEHILPKPFDPRLILKIAPAVARAAMASGVARRPIADFDAYQTELEKLVYRSGQLLRGVFNLARGLGKRVAYAEGEDARVLRAVQTVVDERLAEPVLIGRRAVIAAEIEKLGLRLDLDRDLTVLDPEADLEIFAPLIDRYQQLVDRRGVNPAAAARALRRRTSVATAMLLEAGHVDAALCGGTTDWWQQMTYVLPIIPRKPGVSRIYAMTGLIGSSGTLFFCDTHMNVDPTAEQIAEMTLLAAESVQRLGEPMRAALLSHSNFGASRSPTAQKMRQALTLVRERAPELEIDGEMHADAALDVTLRNRVVTASPLKGAANLLIMPTLDAANIAVTLLAASSDALAVGPIMLGMAKPIQILIPAVTDRAIVDLTAISVADAMSRATIQIDPQVHGG